MPSKCWKNIKNITIRKKALKKKNILTITCIIKGKINFNAPSSDVRHLSEKTSNIQVKNSCFSKRPSLKTTWIKNWTKWMSGDTKQNWLQTYNVLTSCNTATVSTPPYRRRWARSETWANNNRSISKIADAKMMLGRSSILKKIFTDEKKSEHKFGRKNFIFYLNTDRSFVFS